MSMFRRKLLMQQAQYVSLPEPIAKYEAYNCTNESDGKEILTDLTGNGHDIQLYNFAFAVNSGYGKYVRVYLGGNASLTSIKLKLYNYSKVVMTRTTAEGEATVTIYEYRISPGDSIPVTKVKITGLTGSGVVLAKHSSFANNDDTDYISEDGIYIFKSITNSGSIPVYPGLKLYSGYDIDCNIVVEQIPEYKGALVSDGVDDYGLCENLPILTKEKGYTVCAIRRWLQTDGNASCLVSKNFNNDSFNGSFIVEVNGNSTSSWGRNNAVIFETELFTFQKSDIYNNQTIKQSTSDDSDNLCLFKYHKSSSKCAKIALYALEIYDRDLTDSEINAVKTRMLKKYNNQEDTTSGWYGIEWYTNQSSSAVTRIGNANLHKSLPIQSGMYRCVLNDNGEEVYKLDPNDSTKKEDGTPAVLDGTDGMVMVWIPIFYAKFETKGYRRRVLLSDHYKPGFKRMGGCYVSAYEAAIDRTASGTPKLASVVNTTENFRGGNNNAEWDGTYRTLLGMPATLTSLTNFRTYARNRKADSTEWNCMEYEAYKAIYWIYVVEYANLNCQFAFNDELTAEGFRQGGLGAGVTNINGTKWNEFNGYYPFIPCGHTNSLGNKTGVVAFTMPDEYDAETPITTYVPSYRGIENPFGHLWKWTDGIHVKVQSEEAGGKSILYTSDNPANYQDTNYEGYQEKGEIARANGYVKKILFGDDGDIIVSKDGNTGGSPTTYFCDYFYTNIPSSGEVLRGVWFGGNANNGVVAGFTCAYTATTPSYASASFGSRLCFIPNNNN